MATYVSTGAFKARNLPDIISSAESLGLTHLELSSGCAPMPDFDAFVPRLESSPLILSVHNYFPAPVDPFVLNLGSLDPATLERSRNHVRLGLGLTSRLGGRYYSVHSAFAITLKPEMLGRPGVQAEAAAAQTLPDRDSVRETFVESLRTLAGEARSLGLDLLVENNVLSPQYFRARGGNPILMVTAEEIEEVIGEVGAENLGLLLDVAHARVSASALGFDLDAFMSRLAGLTRAVHVSDNDGMEDQNLPFGEDSWFWPHLAALAHLDVVIEVYSLEPERILSQLALMRRKLDQRIS